MAKEGVQEDVKISSTKTHPLKGKTYHVPTRLDRSTPTLLPRVVIRREKRVRARLLFRDPQTVGRLPEYLAVVSIKPLVIRGRLCESAYLLKLHGREGNSDKNPRLSVQQTPDHGGGNQRGLPLRGTIDVTVGGTKPPPRHVETVDQVARNDRHDALRADQVRGPQCHFLLGESLLLHETGDHVLRRKQTVRC